MTAEQSEELQDALKRAAMERDAVLGISDQYGTRYIIDFVMERRGRAATIRSCWIVLKDENGPRFVTSFVL